jgi:conjugal transfer/type IV secretion protein DotA/TraY
MMFHRLPHIPFTARQAVGYVTLPRLLPRVAALNIRFPYVAYLMAGLLGMVGLIAPTHPALNPALIGTYSVRQVFFIAAGNLTFRRTHMDQIIMFGVLLAGAVLLAVQFAVMFGYLAIGVAQAAGIGFGSIFTTPNPTNDIALMLLDRVFGVPGMYNSCISTAQVCEATSTQFTPSEPATFPEGHHIAFQSLFAYYSMGAMVIGMMIVLYYIAAVVLESVHTGVPFGKRFASVYAPVRLCLAVLMLVPVPTPGTNQLGYNGAQYMTLWLAGLGSGFGTNIWNVFNNTFVMTGQRGVQIVDGFGPTTISPATNTSKTVAHTMIAQPKSPRVDSLVQFMMLARSCAAMYDTRPIQELRPLGNDFQPDMKQDPFPVDMYVTGADGFMAVTSDMSFQTAKAVSNARSLKITFGIEDPEKGEIRPVCGTVSIRLADSKSVGASYVQNEYFLVLKQLWTDPMIMVFGKRVAALYMAESGSQEAVCKIIVPEWQAWGSDAQCGSGAAGMDLPQFEYYNKTRSLYQDWIDEAVIEARAREVAAFKAPVDNRILNRGWAGAGIWYNKLASLNGSLFDGVKAAPEISQMPDVMERVARARAGNMQSVTTENRYNPSGVKGDGLGNSDDIAIALNRVYTHFLGDQFALASAAPQTGNIIFDLMNKFFGTEPLFEMRKDPDINPLVQMVALGKSVVDAAFFNILAGGAIEAAGGTLSQLDGWQKFGKGLDTLGDTWFTVATIGLGIGIMLYYIVPFMPFIYFFFSVVKWMQSIFEAMIGMPMWALAHLRIDGDGLAPEAAQEGYMLLLEILIRPALTVISLVGSFIIFTAMVYTLNDVFDLLTVNLTGYQPPSTGDLTQDLAMKRGTLDQFFYTVLYTVLVYMMAVGSFKLVDLFPAQILRWMASSAKNVIDEAGDPAGKLISSVYIGSFGMPLVQQGGMIGQAITGMREAAKGTGGVVGESLQKALKPADKGGGDGA